MKIKIALVFFFIFFVIQYACAEPLKAGISYTVDEAQIIAFSNTPITIDINKYSKYFLDLNYDKNMKAIKKNKQEFKDRFIGHFSNGQYGITYKNDLSTSYYYNSKGDLSFIEIDTNKIYPRKSIVYDKTGQLDSVTLSVTPDEQFVFDLNKKLIAHWIKNNCYDKQGYLIMTRQ